MTSRVLNAMKAAWRELSGNRRAQFKYDATTSKNKRKAPDGILRSEDAELTNIERRKLLSAARDIPRNFSLAAWMIRKHLDYVSTFTFRSCSGSDRVDNIVEAFIRNWSKAKNCDVAGRHPLRRLIRLAECRRTVDGDIGIIKLNDGRLQAIEGDRIRTPDGGIPGFTGPMPLLHGVQTDDANKAIAYCVCKRLKQYDQIGGSSAMIFERMVPAENMILHGYFDRVDQTRGISPFAPALNTLRDTYEGFDLALAKAKVQQMFALSIFRESSDSLGTLSDLNAESEVEDDEEEEDEEATTEDEGPRYKIDLGAGPQILDLDPNDRAEFLESSSPSDQFQNFSQIMISVSMKALDLPFSFYAENYANYSGARQALLQYEMSAQDKRSDNNDLLDELTFWRLMIAIEDGEIDVKPEDIRFEWIPTGLPWIDPLNEVQAGIAALGAGLTSRTRILREQGIDWRDVVREQAQEKKVFEAAGLPLSANPLNALIPGVAAK